MGECYFCNNTGGNVLINNDLFRIIEVIDGDYPGYLRIVLNQHIKELSDLSDIANLQIYQALIKCERILRAELNPEKINLASFGNVTPHVHWHIIPRFLSDKHFPNPTWGEIVNPEYTPSETLIKNVTNMIRNFNSLFLAV